MNLLNIINFFDNNNFSLISFVLLLWFVFITVFLVSILYRLSGIDRSLGRIADSLEKQKVENENSISS